MARVNLSMEEWNKVVKSLNTLMEKLYETTKECIDYKKQRDELINDMAEVKRKAEAFDEILDINIDKDELLSEEYIEKVNDVIQEWKFS
ncbi:MAG: hypothetical protein E7F54_05425 [Staphylococcus sp.]|nr:hypothetical protein [Staphylococcus sp.]DAI85690.1 MAG TPA: Protein of unknown function (DUF1024) [Caudoviricetes sp.]